MKWQKIVEHWQRTRKYLRSRLRELVDDAVGGERSAALLRGLGLGGPRQLRLARAPVFARIMLGEGVPYRRLARVPVFARIR